MPDAPKRILIVDDEKDICEILKLKFEKSNFQVLLAHDGIEALRRVLENRPQCVLLDIRMPKEDGLTFLRKLRSFRDDDNELESFVRKLPVVVLTGAGENMKSLFQAEGVQDYVEKPFDFDILRSRVEKTIG